jgi:hypothetical protein
MRWTVCVLTILERTPTVWCGTQNAFRHYFVYYYIEPVVWKQTPLTVPINVLEILKWPGKKYVYILEFFKWWGIIFRNYFTFNMTVYLDKKLHILLTTDASPCKIHFYSPHYVIILLCTLTSNAVLPGSSGTTVRYNTQNNIPHSNKTQNTKLHKQ